MWLIKIFVMRLIGGVILMVCLALALGFPGAFIVAFFHETAHGHFALSLLAAVSAAVSLAFWAGVRTTRIGFAATERILEIGLEWVGDEP